MNIKTKFPATYFLLRCVLANGDEIDFADCDWTAQLVPTSENTVYILITPNRWAFSDVRTLREINRDFRGRRGLALIEYVICGFVGKKTFFRNFQHEFELGTTFLEPDQIIAPACPLIEARSLNEILNVKSFPGQQTIQFIS